jgi:hypothetical protein
VFRDIYSSDLPKRDDVSRHSQLMNTSIVVRNADIVSFPCDALVLKFAQGFYGADGLVANLIGGGLSSEIRPALGEHVLLPSHGKVAAGHVLFVGVVPLYQFDYEKIREFTSRSLRILAKELPGTADVAMTMHGVGYGLDESEAFLAQVAGLLDALRENALPEPLKRISIVEFDARRAARLENLLEDNLPEKATTKNWESAKDLTPPPNLATAGEGSKDKAHVFVAMPFSEDTEDTFEFGIKGPVNSAGYLCEKTDLVSFTGDVLGRIKSRIETADLVVADVTGANANVYLEVGYAWGKDRPTLLLAKKGEELKFDVQGQRCLLYKNITDLAKQLRDFLNGLSAGT